ncbi:diacylglycerol kinase [Vibrio ostreicida]|uniref:Diacylglycerol kinase n=1 Tax=Vibrio ostreicida TaxID=526588 RepID=A0ABT8BQB7_9VIBR|nr:diacylglycerol kinase [Vibrio ostreicida]MDN3609341.1 diacylglycerol kinase [Vibrio ostreicida]NPD08233.1 diacylglycerol kinase [Vibrio ostreicida]
MKPGKRGLKRILYAVRYSLKGLKAGWCHEAAFRQEIVMSVVLSIVAFFLPVTHMERTMMVASLWLIVIVELINSAVEATVDRIGDEWHPLSGRAKDLGSSAVMVSFLLAVFVWLSILIK